MFSKYDGLYFGIISLCILSSIHLLPVWVELTGAVSLIAGSAMVLIISAHRDRIAELASATGNLWRPLALQPPSSSEG